jgi:hypothetical protein
MSPPVPNYAERRAEPREPANLRARVMSGKDLAMWADCVIRDLSTSGAKIELSHVYQLPPRFVLLRFDIGVAFEVVLKWRRADLAGMAFEARHDLANDTPPHLAKVKEAWLALKTG